MPTPGPERIAANLEELRELNPMVHHITNSVVTNFTANITLCMGASPVMAPCIDESPAMVRYAGALLLNIGTLDPPQIESMLAAGRAANGEGIPVVLDPVGAGATPLRTDSALRLLEELDISVIRANAGELMAVSGEGGAVRGVDSMETLDGRQAAFEALAREAGLVVAVTGEVDCVTDGRATVMIRNGHPLMGRVTGTGCGATTAVACFLASCSDPLDAAVSALACYGIAGQLAGARASGPGSFVPAFLDSIAMLDKPTITETARLS